MAPPSRRLRAESEAITRADVVIVDGDNVRGKLHFRWSAYDLAKSTAAWAREQGLTGKILLFYDHGDAADALWTDDGLAVAFSGHISADDQIVAAVRSLSCEHGAVVTVATADSNLRLRCAKAVRCRRHLHIVSPIALIAALQESARSDTPDIAEAEVEEASSLGTLRIADFQLAPFSDGAPPLLGDQQQLRARQIECDLRSVRKQLRRGTGQKMRSKLLRRRAQLELAYWKSAQLHATAAQGMRSADEAELEQAAAAGKRQGGPAAMCAAATAKDDLPPAAAAGSTARPTPASASGRELTSDRALNAEAFRRQLRAAGASLNPPADVLSAPSLAHYLLKRFGAAHAGMSVLAQAQRALASASSVAAASPVRELGRNARLLALDVGERQGGFAVLDAASGALLAYGGLSGSPLLCDRVLAQLRDAIAATGGSLERLVLEGNSQMCQHWREALFAKDGAGSLRGGEGATVADDEGAVDVVSVTAQSWRASMLTRREQQCGKLSAKEAARRIARQLLARSGLADAAGSRLDTNAAEAVCVGHWACAFLWKPAESAASDGATGTESAERIEWPWVLVERTIAGEVILR